MLDLVTYYKVVTRAPVPSCPPPQSMHIWSESMYLNTPQIQGNQESSTQYQIWPRDTRFLSYIWDINLFIGNTLLFHFGTASVWMSGPCPYKMSSISSDLGGSEPGVMGQCCNAGVWEHLHKVWGKQGLAFCLSHPWCLAQAQSG